MTKALQGEELHLLKTDRIRGIKMMKYNYYYYVISCLYINFEAFVYVCSSMGNLSSEIPGFSNMVSF